MPFGFPLRPTSPSTVGRLEVAQIQARCFRTCVGSQTPGAPARLAYRRAGYCLPPAPTASAPPTDIDCEARCPSLCLPLSTLRPQPRGCQRMTQGRGGLLGLPRMALSSTTLLLAHWRLPGLQSHPASVTDRPRGRGRRRSRALRRRGQGPGRRRPRRPEACATPDRHP